MDVLFGIIVMGFVSILSVGILYKTISQRYPPVKIDVYDRGLKQRITFRLWGFTIVKNNLFRLLLNEPELCGDIRTLQFDVEAGMMGKERIYRAYRRHDYLFGLIQIKKVKVMQKIQVPTKVTKQFPDGTKEVEQMVEQEQMIEYPLESNPPQIKGLLTEDGKNIKASLSKEGLLFPFGIYMANDGVQEEEISKGKAICVRFIDSQKSTKAYLQASNPLMTVIYTTLPVLLIVVALGVTLYLVLQGVSDNIVEIARIQADTVAKLAELTQQIK